MKLNIIICADSGKRVGLGHLHRCIAIAKELRKLSFNVEFLFENSRYGHLAKSAGFKISDFLDTSTTHDMIILDSYSLNDHIMKFYRKHCRLLVRIDDAAPEVTIDKLSDVIINGNPYATPELYNRYVKAECNLILGSKYMPISKEFCHARDAYQIRKSVNTLLITFGASEEVASFAWGIAKLVASGENNIANIYLLMPSVARGKTMTLNGKSRLFVLPYVDRVHELFCKADIAICCSGTTCWQLCTIGVPFITFQTADNQVFAFNYIRTEKIGVALSREEASYEKLCAVINNMDYTSRKNASELSRSIIDCRGSERIASRIKKISS